MYSSGASQVALVVNSPPVNAGDGGDMGSISGLRRSLGGEHGDHSSILAWRIPWIEKPSGLLWGHKKSDMTEATCLLFFFN